MDLSNLSNNLPKSKPIKFKKNQNTPSSKKSSTSNCNETNISSAVDSTNNKSQDNNNISLSTFDINQELTNNFKDAAKSVASLYNSSLNNEGNGKQSVKSDFALAAKSVATLYKLSQQHYTQSFNQGYLQCLDDICSILTNDEDIENWVLTRKAEILKDQNQPPSTSSSSPVSSPISIATNTNANHVSESMDEFKLGHNYDFYFNSQVKPPRQFKPSIPPLSVQHNSKQRNNPPHVKKLHQMKKFSDAKASSQSDDSSGSEETDDSNMKRHQQWKYSPSKKKKLQ